MRATFTEEQEALASTAADLASGGRQAARAALEGEELPAEPTASLISGYGGLAVSEEAGGMGGSLVDLAIVLEALGREVVPTPWVSHVLAIQVAHAAGLDVAEAAGGEARWALAEPRDGALGEERLPERVAAVPDGVTADAVVLVAGTDVAVGAPSAREPRAAFDVTRPLADLRFDGAPQQRAPGADDPVRRAVAALSAELVGVGRGAVDLAVDYANEREQFGQAIGRFQGVAHQLADAWTGVESAWSLALYACWAVDAQEQDAGRAVDAAKATAGQAAVHAAERGTQVHGGIGVTWEADPHLYLRRALDGERRLRSARRARRDLGAALVADAGAAPGG